MNKKTVLGFVLCSLLLCSVILFSGCMGINEDPKVQYKKGLLSEVEHSDYPIFAPYYFIFNDDSVFEANTVPYNETVLQSFKNKNIEIRYFDHYGITIIDIKEV